MIPCEDSATQVYRRLFLQGSAAEIEQQVDRLRQGQSILDSVAAHAGTLGGQLGAEDRARLDQYITGVRELERRLVLAQAWSASRSQFRGKRNPSIRTPAGPICRRPASCTISRTWPLKPIQRD